MNLLALDVGTSSVKAAILDAATAQPLHAIVKVAYDLDQPTPDAAAVAAEPLWSAISTAAQQVAARGPRVEAIGLSCLTPALVLLDAADRPLGPIWIHLDRRSRPIARRVQAEVGHEFLASVGNRPLPGGLSVMSCRQRFDTEPGLAPQVRSYLHANGWLGWRLTGVRAFDPGNACFTGLFDTLRTQTWSERWCHYFGIDPAWLPPVVCGSTTLGGLRAEVAQAWGVPADVPVKLGTADTSSAMLAANLRPGDLLHVVGTTQVLGVIVAEPRPDERRLTRRLGVGPEFVYVAHNPVGGVALDWLHQLCFRDQTAEQFFGTTIPTWAERSSTVTFAPPFLGGDRLNIEPMQASFNHLTVATEREDLLVALLHAMRAGHRAALASLGNGSPTSAGRVFLTGGGAETVRRLLPEYATTTLHTIDEGSLRGVAALFR
jgi:xylulokinase